MVEPTQSSSAQPAKVSRWPSIEPALRIPLLSALIGIVAAAALGFVLPPLFALPASVAVMGLAGLSALLALDTHRRHQIDAVSRNVGELNVRLGATRVKLDGLRSRLDSEPLRETDIEPTRLALAELTAEVGLLGGVLRDVATAVSEHEAKLAETTPGGVPQQAAPAVPSAGPKLSAPAVAVPAEPASLFAEAPDVVDRGLVRRDEARDASILSAFAAGGLEVHLQPVVALPQRKTVGYEALSRLRLSDGSVLLPAEFMAIIDRAGQGANLDAQVLTQALAVAGHINAKGHDHFISLNLSNRTWSQARALVSVARVLETYRSQAARIIIEIPQRVWRQLDPTHLGVVGGMAANGIRFAIDQVSDLRFDPAALADRGVRFVKAHASMLAQAAQSSSALDIAASDLAQLLRRAGIELIGERAETDRMVADMLDLDISFAQGFAISEPRPIKPEVFQTNAQARASEEQPVQAKSDQDAPVAVVPLAPAPAAPQRERPADRIPFRAVLRRA